MGRELHSGEMMEELFTLENGEIFEVKKWWKMGFLRVDKGFCEFGCLMIASVYPLLFPCILNR